MATNQQEIGYRFELLKEYVFEEVRAERFRGAPSRKRCIFLFDQELDPAAYASQIGFGLDHYKLIEVETSAPGGQRLRAKLSLLNCNAEPYPQMLAKAELYWRGTEERDLDTEVLYVGRYRILREVPL